MISGIVGFVAATIEATVEATVGTRKTKPAPLTAEEQKLYDKLVKDLLAAFSAAGRVEGLDIPTSKPQKSQYAIIFRQSKSWGMVERLLTEASDTKHPTIKPWVMKWRHRVAQLRQAHYQVQRCLDELKRVNQEREALKAERYLTGLTVAQSDRFEAREKLFNNQIKDLMENTMRGLLREGGVSLNNVDECLFAIDPKFKQVHDYLKDNLPYLTVFSQWREVSPDDNEKIFVKVLLPTNDLRNTLDNTMKNPLKEMVNVSTKAIFIIEETKQVEFSTAAPIKGQEKQGRIFRPAEINIRHRQLAPLTPDPHVKHSSNYEVKDEIIFNQPFPENSKTAQPRSHIAMRLQYIVRCALQKVNQELARITKPEDIKISDKVKQEAEAGLPYRVNRYIVNFMPPIIPTMIGEWWRGELHYKKPGT